MRAKLWLLTSLSKADEYVKVLNGRCLEFEEVTPLGARGADWSGDLDARARAWCSRRSWCVGYMRYMADEEESCHEWCGRPQFCKDVSMAPSEEWVSYVRKSPLKRFQEEQLQLEEAEELPPWARPTEFSCPYPYEGVVSLWNEEPPKEAEPVLRETFQETCRVLRADGVPSQGQADEPSQKSPHAAAQAAAEDGPFFHGVLSETEEMVKYFSADTSEYPWVYFLDNLEYIGETVLGGNTIIGPKLHYLSMFYTSSQAACDGKNKSQWTAEDVEEIFPGHVYVDDGSLETRRAAFLSYHFTAICVGPEEMHLVPQAVVDAVGFGTHPLVPSAVHERLQRVFFHLPDAVQPFVRLHPLILEGYLEDMYNNPAKNDAMYYKQTFLFLMMELFRYRYRHDIQTRIRNSACALCTDQRKLQTIQQASLTDGPPEIAIAFCLMSRRSGSALRTAIRQTWARRLGPTSALRFFVGKVEGGAFEDQGAPDVVELDAPESYEAVTLKALSMLHWARQSFPQLRFLVRGDDDVYLRPFFLLRQLEQRPAVGYLWGNFDSGSSVVRDPTHPHYNSEEQLPIRDHPMFGDIFPPYVRGHLWAMSADLLARLSDVWAAQLREVEDVTLQLAKSLPHPDDPAIGVIMASLVDMGDISLAVDDRDLNHFALNPSCNATYLNIHNRTWVIHHVTPEAMQCFWSIDEQEEEGELPDLCSCSMDVVEEKSGNPDDDEFDYPRERFNE
ncbi:unnamed protein product [Effrenium voratum]|nr:unnamed protein product [Effrenium voratum]